MTPLEVVQILDYFQNAWPWVTLADHSAEVWADALADVDGPVGQKAARRLVQSEDRPPSIKRFVDEARKLTRDALPALPAGHETSDRAEAARRIRAIRIGMTEAAKEVPAHSNHDSFGGANCPACSTRSEREHVGTLVAAAIRSELEGESGAWEDDL